MFNILVQTLMSAKPGRHAVEAMRLVSTCQVRMNAARFVQEAIVLSVNSLTGYRIVSTLMSAVLLRVCVPQRQSALMNPVHSVVNVLTANRPWAIPALVCCLSSANIRGRKTFFVLRPRY